MTAFWSRKKNWTKNTLNKSVKIDPFWNWKKEIDFYLRPTLFDLTCGRLGIPADQCKRQLTYGCGQAPDQSAPCPLCSDLWHSCWLHLPCQWWAALDGTTVCTHLYAPHLKGKEGGVRRLVPMEIASIQKNTSLSAFQPMKKLKMIRMLLLFFKIKFKEEYS